MYILFIISIIGLFSMLPIHFLSVEHLSFQKKYGKEKGLKFTKILGIISGWGFFLFLIGIWISPQPKFIIPFFENFFALIPIFNFAIIIFHLIISLPLIICGAYFGISGVKAITLKVSETHKTEMIITSGIYSRVRHPQYLGAIIAHFGLSVLLSMFFSLLVTPLIILYIHIISWKEEKELIKEFGEQYEIYKRNVPMFIPKLKTSQKS
jgi:protein-S-isoprenylcysteine O-methyltransferase Ste14